MISFDFSSNIAEETKMIKRNWKAYNEESLLFQVIPVDWVIEEEDVQGYWHAFENKLIVVANRLCSVGALIWST
jgi:hypothetical protein